MFGLWGPFPAPGPRKSDTGCDSAHVGGGRRAPGIVLGVFGGDLRGVFTLISAENWGPPILPIPPFWGE